MRVLFLDIDGVLNSRDYMLNRREIRRPAPHSIDALAVPRLNAITDRTGAKIVVSSTWRMGRTVPALREILGAHGVTGDVIDKTPHLLEPLDCGIPGAVKGRERGHEIDAWLKSCPVVVDSFAIVDDDSDMVHLSHRLVQTTFEMGLQDEHVERIVALLNDGGEGR